MERLQYNDFDYLSYAEWISGDYNDFVKRTILPRFIERYPLKIREIRVLITISEFDGMKTAAEIAEHLRQDPATVTRAMVILIGKGFVVSKENFHDGRSRILTLTKNGYRANLLFFDLFETAIRAIPSQYREDEIIEALKTLSARAHALHASHKTLSHLLKARVIQTV